MSPCILLCKDAANDFHNFVINSFLFISRANQTCLTLIQNIFFTFKIFWRQIDPKNSKFAHFFNKKLWQHICSSKKVAISINEIKIKKGELKMSEIQIKKCLFAITAILALASQKTFAAPQESLHLGQPVYGGNACPQGSASAAISPDGSDLSILFDQFQVEAGSNGKRLDRKACNIAIPLHVPQGFSVSVFTIDYRGFASVPMGGRAMFSAEYFFAGSRGPSASKVFAGGTNQNYTFTNKLQAQALVWTPCGADTNLRVNSSMLVQSNSRLDDALATVDSADVHSGIVFHIQWRECSQNEMSGSGFFY